MHFEEGIQDETINVYNDSKNKNETDEEENGSAEEGEQKVNQNLVEPIPEDHQKQEMRKSTCTETKPGYLIDYEMNMAYCLRSSDPASYSEAIQQGNSQEAIEKEVKSLEEHGTCIPAVLPKDVKAIDTRWIFKTKPNGTRKARLVAKGYQEHNVRNVYAPAARISTVRLMLSNALQKNWSMRQLDIPLAFLNGKIKSRTFIKTPDGIKNEKGKVLELQKSLYGLCWRLWRG